MKKLLIIKLLFIGLTVQSQTTLELIDPFISFGFDAKMAIKGAGYSYGNTPSLDYEIRAGYFPTQNNKIRISHAYKKHKRIGFVKYTYIAVDRKISLFNNVNIFTGLEVSGITRESFTYHYTKPNDYIRFTTNPVLFGGNIEMQYRPKKSRFSLFVKGSMYQSETILKKYKKYRKEITIGVLISFFKSND